MNMPSHHQSAFFEAVRLVGVDLVVHYYGLVSDDRKMMGWEAFPLLPTGEVYVPSRIESIEVCPDWRERIHIVPGYGTAFTRKLASYLSDQDVRWVHWSESSHQGFRWWLSYPRKWSYARLLNRHAVGAFAIGELARHDFMRWGIREDKIVLLPYSPRVPKRGEKVSLEVARFCRQSHPVFMYVGALCKRKGIDVLLRAFARSLAQCHVGVLVLVGNDMRNGEYQRLAHKLGIGERVLFAGSVLSSAVYSTLECADVIVLPSRFDGWGAVISEAASVGRAIIASDSCGAAHHLILAGETGFRVGAGDVLSLAVAMQQYMRDPNLASRHGRRSLENWGQFSPEKNAERLLGGLEELHLRSVKGTVSKRASLV
jgi:glycosyltransferase involved in cell wall biosynthesis